MKHITISFILAFTIIGCAKDSTDKPPIPKQIEIPFQDFWMSTKFAAANVNTPGSTPDYFNTWGAAIADGKSLFSNNYYVYLNGSVNVPSNCSRSFVQSGSTLTANVTCKLTRTGTINPNAITWPEVIDYKIDIIADMNMMKVTKAELNMITFNKVIDFTKQAIVFINKDANQKNSLILTSGSTVLVDGLQIQITFTQRLD